MAWIKVDDQMVDHPKIEPLSLEAFWWLHRGLSYAARFLTDGRLPRVFLSKVPRLVVAELTTTRHGQTHPVWHRDRDGTVRIHDYLEYQPSKADVEHDRQVNRAKQATYRNRRNTASRNPVSNPVTTPVSNGAPSRPVPSPIKSTPQPPLQGGRRRRRGELTEAQVARLDRQNAAITEQIQLAKRKEARTS